MIKNSPVFKSDIISLFKDSIQTLFNIQRGEERRTLLMFGQIFLIITSLMMIKPVSNSLFFTVIGAEKLPLAFLLTAFCAAAISTFYSRILVFFQLGDIVRKNMVVNIFFLLVFRILLSVPRIGGWLYYIFYVWVSIFALISVSQFWITANIVFNMREAKRLFGFIGAGAIAGGIIGGYLTNLLAPLVGSENLLLVAALLLYFCIMMSKRLQFVVNLNTGYKPDHRLNIRREHPFRLIIKSSHLTFLASIIIISVIVSKLAEFQFGVIIAEHIEEEDRLTAFLGFWLSNLNIISLVVQLFVTRRVVGVFGVGTSLFFLPAGLLFGALAVLVFPVLWAAVFLKVCDGSLKNSINKAGLELLALPIPVEIKNQTKSFIDIFGDSFATGLSGLLLLLLTFGFDLPVRYISLAIILLLTVWIVFILKVKKEYIQSFRLKMEKSGDHPTGFDYDLKNESVLKGLMRVLGGKNTTNILKVLRMVNEIKEERLLPFFVRLIEHPSLEIRLEVLKNIYNYPHVDLRSRIEPLLGCADQAIVSEAMYYIFQFTPLNRVELLLSFFNHREDSLRYAALLCAARESKLSLEYQGIFHTSKESRKPLNPICICRILQGRPSAKYNWRNASVHPGWKIYLPICTSCCGMIIHRW